MFEKEKKCTDNKINCPTCKLEVDVNLLGKRCPRCNSVIMPTSCENCKNTCN